MSDDEPGPDPSSWPRLIGTIKKWTKKGESLRIAWYDGEQSNVLRDMTDAEFQLRLEKYADGRDPPRTRGVAVMGRVVSRQRRDQMPPRMM